MSVAMNKMWAVIVFDDITKKKHVLPVVFDTYAAADAAATSWRHHLRATRSDYGAKMIVSAVNLSSLMSDLTA